jgi:hypothetical protein
VIGAEALVVPPWWDTFWREHRTTLNCDERAAKEILFAVRNYITITIV